MNGTFGVEIFKDFLNVYYFGPCLDWELCYPLKFLVLMFVHESHFMS